MILLIMFLTGIGIFIDSIHRIAGACLIFAAKSILDIPTNLRDVLEIRFLIFILALKLT